MYKRLTPRFSLTAAHIVPARMCIACGEMTYKPGVGCSHCGYIGD
jgi:ribosomal protein L37E